MPTKKFTWNCTNCKISPCLEWYHQPPDTFNTLPSHNSNRNLWGPFLAQLSEILQTAQGTHTPLPSPFGQLQHVVISEIFMDMKLQGDDK